MMRSERSRRLFALGAFALIVTPVFAVLALHPGPPRPKWVGEALPAFTVWTADRGSRAIREVAGAGPALVVFAKPECGFCRAELGTLDYLERMNDSAVRLVVVLVPASGEANAGEHLESDAAEMVRRYPRMTVAIDRAGAFQSAFGPGGVPFLVAVSKQGVIRRTARGEKTQGYLEELIRELKG